jgi:Signal transduction histidine kinase
MASETKHRQLIRYSLFACVLLIQIIILLFFYNEYFNAKKLRVIENQLKETRALKSLTNDSKKELFDAQNNLQKYINDNDQNNLELYFQALRKLTGNIDSIKIYENRNLFFKEAVDSIREEAFNLNNLEILIDSIYKRSQESQHAKTSFEIKNFEIGNNAENFGVEVHHSSDSVVKKKLFSRLKDAIKGDVSTKRDTVFITATYGNTIDTDKIKEDFDNTINAMSNHYLNEIKRYQSHISITNSKSNNLYHIYDSLIVSGNNLMEIYDGTINNYNARLEEQYNEQNSTNNKIRRYAVLGLMILLFFVLVVIMYYTKQSFLYERELKAANEEIKRNLNFKNKILSMLSHEIRAPLKIMIIFIDRITKKTSDEKIIDYLKSISFTNNSLLIQANQILEYAKNQEKPIELKPIEFDLRNEIDTILHVFQPYIESRNNVIEIRNEIDPETIVLADNIKIHQVFTNILGNANKFTENGEIKVTVSTASVNTKTVRLYVTVSDTGIGISESDIEKIFEPYYQGMLSDEIDNLGAGLGLNLCKEIIDLFHGNISVKSTLRKGTIVNFEIDLNIIK